MSIAANEPIEGQGSVPDDSQGTPVENSQQEGTGINPAWNDLMAVIPSQLHSQVTPFLQKWDQDYQKGIGKVHSEYESWKPFQEQGIDPEQVNYGLQLLDRLQNNPEEVFDALKSYLQVEDEQTPVTDPMAQEQQEQGQQSTPIDIASIPEFQQMAQMVQAMAELTVQQNSQQLESQTDQELESEFEQVRNEIGDFDEKWVIVQMLADDKLSVKDAATQYQEFVKGILTNANRPGPRVLGGGGSNPNAPVNPSQLDDRGRRDMIAGMLAASKQQQG
jgi:hypothetical protein